MAKVPVERVREENRRTKEQKETPSVPGMSPEEERKLQDDLRKMVNKGTILIHSEQSRDQVVEMLGQGSPIESVADATVMVIQRLDKAARDSGEEIHDMVKVQAAVDLTKQVAEVGAASGKIPQLNPEELDTSLSVGIQKFLQVEIEAGRIDPEGLKADLNQGIQQMPPEEQSELDQQLKGINQTALQSQGQTTAGQAITQEVQQGGLL